MVHGLIHEYVKWARYLYHNAQRRDESLKDLSFRSLTGKGRGSWRSVYTGLKRGGESCLSRRRPESERHYPPYFPA